MTYKYIVLSNLRINLRFTYSFLYCCECVSVCLICFQDGFFSLILVGFLVTNRGKDGWSYFRTRKKESKLFKHDWFAATHRRDLNISQRQWLCIQYSDIATLKKLIVFFFLPRSGSKSTNSLPDLPPGSFYKFIRIKWRLYRQSIGPLFWSAKSIGLDFFQNWSLFQLILGILLFELSKVDDELVFFPTTILKND